MYTIVLDFHEKKKTTFNLQGDGYESDIALDDISLVQGGNCAFLASTTQAPVTPQTAAYECDFEDGSFCDWQVESDDKWVVSSGQTAVYGKAPLIDHTKQNVLGKYAYVPIEGKGGPPYFATLGIRSLPRGVTFCLDFWYQSFISSSTSLNVYMQNGTAAAVVLWSRPGTTVRDQWTHTSINLGTIRGPTHVTISSMKDINTFEQQIDHLYLDFYRQCRTYFNWLCCSR